jgi:hypothetical protein
MREAMQGAAGGDVAQQRNSFRAACKGCGISGMANWFRDCC